MRKYLSGSSTSTSSVPLISLTDCKPGYCSEGDSGSLKGHGTSNLYASATFGQTIATIKYIATEYACIFCTWRKLMQTFFTE